MVRRVVVAGRIAAGFALLIVGGILALPGVPGPGIVVMLLGLVLLSNHFEWARKALAWCKEKAARLASRRPTATSRDASDRTSTRE